MRAAALAVLLAAGRAAAAAADTAGAAERSAPLADNSFLIEEAYNQEYGVVQSITTFTRDRATGDWVGTFTQEWPVPDERHQLGYTLQLARQGGPDDPHSGLGDLLLNYRFRLLGGDDAALAASPRLSLVLPTGDAHGGLGAGGLGLQVNLPASVELAPRLVLHLNAGGTWVPRGEDALGRHQTTLVGAAGAGLVVRLLPRLDALLEALYTRTALSGDGGSSTADDLVLSPGARVGLDFPGDLQIVLGFAVPMGVLEGGSTSVLGYLSVELPFWR